MLRRAFVLLALLTLLPTGALAQQPAVPPGGSPWTVLTSVQADVQENYAIVRVIADIANRGSDPEFPLQVTVPDDAFVSGLTIERDGKIYVASIQPREQARETYDAQKQAQQTGGLVEKARHSSTFAYLVNVANATSVRATLTYERYLAADEGVYDLALLAPVSGFGRDLGARFDVRVHATRGINAAWGTPDASVVRESDGYRLSYSVGARSADAPTPFAVSYQTPDDGDAGTLLTLAQNGTGYFAHRFHAPATTSRAMPEDLVLVLDISGSMSGLKLQQLKDAATQVLQTLGPEDTLHVVLFSGSETEPWPGLRAMTPENRSDAAKQIDAAIAAGGTDLEGAIKTGFASFASVDWAAEEARLPVLAFLTDGQPTVGLEDRAALRRLAIDANAHGAPVFAIAFGADADWSFIHGLAQDGRGAALRVPEGAGAEVDIRRFLGAITTPVLKDVAITYGPGVVAYRATAPLLFAGSEMLVVGTFDPALGLGNVTVRATTPEGARSERAVPVAVAGNASFLPRLVGYERLRQLDERMSAEGESAALVDEATRLAVQLGFVTDRTSLVVTLEPREAASGLSTEPSANATWLVADGGGGPTPPTMALTTMNGGSVASSAYAVTPIPTATTTSATTPGSFTPASGAPAAKVPGVDFVGVGLALLVALALRRR